MILRAHDLPAWLLPEWLHRPVSRTWAFGLLAVLAAVLAAILMLDYTLRPDAFAIRTVELRGELAQVDRARLGRQLAPLLRTGLLRLDLDAVRTAAEQVAWVDVAGVRRSFPHTLVVRVRAERPVARWGAQHWLNDHDEVISLGETRVAKVPAGDAMPYFDGPEGSGRVVSQHYRSFRAALAPAGLHLRSLRLSERRSWSLELDNGLLLEAGRNQPLARVARFARLYPTHFAAQASSILRVDLRYTNGFTIAWRRGAPPKETTPWQKTEATL